jgi:hypothetical protein
LNPASKAMFTASFPFSMHTYSDKKCQEKTSWARIRSEIAIVGAASFLVGYFPNNSSLGIRAFDLEDLGQPIVWFLQFPLLSRQQWKQTRKGIDTNVFVLFGEAQFSTFEPEAVSDFVRVTGTLDFLDSDD